MWRVRQVSCDLRPAGIFLELFGGRFDGQELLSRVMRTSFQNAVQDMV